MKIELTIWRDDWENNRPIAMERHMVEADTKGKCFHDVYDKYERGLRYMNGWYVRLDDPKLEEEYREWLKGNLTVELYYGGGIVD